MHPDSIKDGATLCVEVLDEAVRLVDKAGRGGAEHSDDLPRRLLNQLEQTPYPRTRLNYVSPDDIFGPTAEVGRRSEYVNRKAARDVGKVVSLLLAVLAAGTVAGYLVIYVSASGKFCGAPLSPWAARLVVVWTGVLGATALAMAAAVVLRWRTRNH